MTTPWWAWALISIGVSLQADNGRTVLWVVLGRVVSAVAAFMALVAFARAWL